MAREEAEAAANAFHTTTAVVHNGYAIHHASSSSSSNPTQAIFSSASASSSSSSSTLAATSMGTTTTTTMSTTGRLIRISTEASRACALLVSADSVKHGGHGSSMSCQKIADSNCSNGAYGTPSKGSGSGSGGGSVGGSTGSATPSRSSVHNISGCSGAEIIQALPEPATLGVSLDEITEEIWAKRAEAMGEGGGDGGGGGGGGGGVDYEDAKKSGGEGEVEDLNEVTKVGLGKLLSLTSTKASSNSASSLDYAKTGSNLTINSMERSLKKKKKKRVS